MICEKHNYEYFPEKYETCIKCLRDKIKLVPNNTPFSSENLDSIIDNLNSIQVKGGHGKMINYSEEQARLQSYKPEDESMFWRPSVGQYSVKALSELEEAEPYEDKAQAKIKLLIDGKEKIWTFSVGKTQASTYGQFVRLAVARNNKLTNTEFKIVVNSDGKKNSYTIVI
jgi:hypothetical protein